MRTKKVTVMALAIALAMILSFVESQIPAFVSIPGVKMGLANIAVVFVLYQLGWKEAALISLIRVFLVSILFGSFASLFYTDVIRYYLPFLVLSGTLAGIVIGLLAGILVKRIRVEG